MAWGNHLLFYAWNIKIKYQMGKWILLYKGWEQDRKGFVVEGELAREPDGIAEPSEGPQSLA